MSFSPKLIIGLGNPDKKYENTYHNVGHLFVDYLAGEALKSDEFMNESGKYVAKAVKKFGVKPEELLVVHDDSDIEIGKYKLTPPGHGSAGHHGIESIEQHLKTNNFWRLRIGIRPKQKEGEERMKALDFVLKKISLENKKILETVFEEAKKELAK